MAANEEPRRRDGQLAASLRDSKVNDRKARFAKLNEFVRARNGWITSISGEREVTRETLEGSASLPAELHALGYLLTARASAFCRTRSLSGSHVVSMVS
jgi:hypothetical protein